MILLMIIAGLFILGLCFGSFVNALVWRLREKELLSEEIEPLKGNKSSKVNTKKLAELDARFKDLSIMRGRSMCTDCGHTLAWFDLIPLVSWLSLKGRCRYCSKRISIQYPLVELITAGLFVFSYKYWPQEIVGQAAFDFSIWLVVLVGFMALIVYDLKWFILPNVIVYPLVALTFFQRLIDSLIFDDSWSALVNSILAAGIGGGIFYVLFQVSKGKWIGGGDVKLGFALGFLVATPVLALLLLMIASFIGLFLSVPTILKSKEKRGLEIPFGPCLIIACIVLVLSGQSILDWYLDLLYL